MKKFNSKKMYALLSALLTGGMTIGLIGLLPQTAEAGVKLN